MKYGPATTPIAAGTPTEETPIRERILPLIEAFLLFCILFVPGITAPGPIPQVVLFSMDSMLLRVMLYDVPALAFILFLLFRSRSPCDVGFPRLRPVDALVAIATLAGLLLVSMALGLLAQLLPMIKPAPELSGPGTPAEYAVLFLAGGATGYLEEGYFRAYLLTRMEDSGMPRLHAVIVSGLLFAICHLYEGIWGFMNALLASALLALAYYWKSSVHGPAWAHAAYNAIAYLRA